MNRFFKLYKFLFEDDKYKDIGLNSKVAYCVYRDLIQQNRNVKKDKDGKVYIKNPRKYLMNTLNVSINTVTKIHKELNRVGLIKDVLDDVGKPNIVYINYCEASKPQVIHKTYEAVKVEEKKSDLLKRIGTSEVSLALEKCKNSVRDSEYVILKLVNDIEQRIKDYNW